jgi:hypothetical protein|nr:MAG TPA: hypothetical protein [Caudoviricetes sp.]
MEQTKREIYNEMMHNYLTEELIKEVQERTKLLDEDYAESIKMQELHLQELKSCLNKEQTEQLEEYITEVSTNHRLLCREIYLQGMRDCADIFFDK